MNMEGLTRENVASHFQKYKLSLGQQSGGALTQSRHNHLSTQSPFTGRPEPDTRSLQLANNIRQDCLPSSSLYGGGHYISTKGSGYTLNSPSMIGQNRLLHPGGGLLPGSNIHEANLARQYYQPITLHPQYSPQYVVPPQNHDLERQFGPSTSTYYPQIISHYSIHPRPNVAPTHPVSSQYAVDQTFQYQTNQVMNYNVHPGAQYMYHQSRIPQMHQPHLYYQQFDDHFNFNKTGDDSSQQ